MRQGWAVACDPVSLTSSQVRLPPLGSCILRTRRPLTQGVVWGEEGWGIIFKKVPVNQTPFLVTVLKFPNTDFS